MYIQNMKTATIAPKKSQKLTRAEYKAFKKFVSTFDTIQLCANALTVSRLTVYNVLFRRSGKPITISKIRKAATKGSL